MVSFEENIDLAHQYKLKKYRFVRAMFKSSWTCCKMLRFYC